MHRCDLPPLDDRFLIRGMWELGIDRLAVRSTRLVHSLPQELR
jgi:hypothetical protein